MALSASRGMIAGAYHLQAAFRNANGYPMGTDTTPDTVSNGSTTHAYYIGGFDSFTAPTPTIDVAINRGGQKQIGRMPLGVADFGTPAITLSEFNEVLNAYIKGTTADVTSMTEWVQSAANSNQLIFDRFIVMLAAKFLDSSDLTEYYMNWVFHNAQWNNNQPPNTSQTAGVNPNPLGYQLDISLSTRQGHTGRPFSASSQMYVVDASDTWTLVRTRWPLGLTTYVDDNSTGSFTLGYRPYYDDATGAAYNSITESGSTTAVTSVNTTTGVVTQAAAADAGDIWVAAYQTKFVAI